MPSINQEDLKVLNDLLIDMGTVTTRTSSGYKAHHQQAAELLRRIQRQVGSNAALKDALQQLDADDFLDGGYDTLINLLSQVRTSLQ